MRGHDRPKRSVTFAEIRSEPALLIHPRCTTLRKALAGKYQFARVQVSGDERFHDKPLKNEYSHPAEALQYMLMGGGEGRSIIRPGPTKAAPIHYPKLHGVY